ncbi:MAG: hypothetical protein PHC34_05485 [Candidatus Gastranaerophilales bacterium]|nr:hypothetical protein [Candidatus Gastranaerophilales bacterium]
MKNQSARIKNIPTRKIKNSINDLTYQICQLRENADFSEEASIKYNRMLIERASLRKKCNIIQSKSVISILFKKFSLKKDPKSICDYFESN